MANALDKLKASLGSKWNDGKTVFRASELGDKGVVSSGSLCLDYMTGVFGIPRNVVIELAGKPGVSKTTMSLCIINNVLELEFERAKMRCRLEQAIEDGKLEKYELDWFDSQGWDKQLGDLHVFGEQEKNDILDSYELNSKYMQKAYDISRGAIYLDLEGRFDSNWARKYIRQDLFDKVLVVRNDTIEQATDAYCEALRSNAIAVAVLDSIGGAPTDRTFWKSAQIGNVGGNALGMTRFAGFAENMSSKYTCLTICINQVRDDLGGYNRLITPGGNAIKHAFSLRIELKRKSSEVVWDVEPGTKESMYECGFLVHARLHKNSVGRSGQACQFWFYTNDCKYGKAGFDRAREIVNLAILSNVIDKGNAGYYRYDSFPNGRIHGYDATVRYFLDNHDAYNKLYNEMKYRLRNGGIDGATETFDVTTGLAPGEEPSEPVDVQEQE